MACPSGHVIPGESERESPARHTDPEGRMSSLLRSDACLASIAGGIPVLLGHNDAYSPDSDPTVQLDKSGVLLSRSNASPLLSDGGVN